MDHQLRVSPDGRIVVRHVAGHRFDFQVFIRGTPAMCMIKANWAVGGSSDSFDIMDRAKRTAETAAIRRGWLTTPVHWAAL